MAVAGLLHGRLKGADRVSAQVIGALRAALRGGLASAACALQHLSAVPLEDLLEWTPRGKRKLRNIPRPHPKKLTN